MNRGVQKELVEPLDGNAIAGALFEHFGHEMTMAEVRRSHCQSTMMMAELRVYMKAPGGVARCPTCDDVVMVIVNVRGTQRFDMPNVEMGQPHLSRRFTTRHVDARR